MYPQVQSLKTPFQTWVNQSLEAFQERKKEELLQNHRYATVVYEFKSDLCINWVVKYGC